MFLFQAKSTVVDSGLPRKRQSLFSAMVGPTDEWDAIGFSGSRKEQ